MPLVHQYVLDSALRYPEKSAIICGENKLSYFDFIAKINALADMFIVEGMRKGDRVLILLHDNINFLVTAYAVIRSGGIAVPLFAAPALETIQYVANDCKPFIIVTSRKDLAQYPLMRDKLSCHFFFIDDATRSPLHHISVRQPGSQVEPADVTDRITKLMDLREEDGALIFYTANFDGHLRGALFTHKSFIYSTQHVNAFMRIDSSLREYIALPLTQSMGFGRARCTLFTGGTIVVDNDPLTSSQLINNLIKYQCNGLSLAPVTLSTLFNQEQKLLNLCEPLIRCIELGTTTLSTTDRKALLKMFPQANIFLQYGLTEAPRTTITELRSNQKKGDTVGTPLPETQIMIVDDGGKYVRTGHPGEIMIQGNHLFSRYWSDENNNSSDSDQRWFRTNNIGILDKDGFLRVLGRKDEIINMSGIKISPTEVEEKIHEAYPDVEICVIGIPDPAGIVGEIPVLCYIAREGTPMVSSELLSALSTRLDKNKIPRIVFRVERFPKIENKIVRQELRQQILEGIAHPIHQMV